MARAAARGAGQDRLQGVTDRPWPVHQQGAEGLPTDLLTGICKLSAGFDTAVRIFTKIKTYLSCDH